MLPILRIKMALAMALVAGSAFATARGVAQSSSTPRVTVRLDVRAEDGSGQLVRDLTIGDFRVIEDGKRQTLTAVSLIDLPKASDKEAASAQGARDVASNLAKQGSRSFILLISDGFLPEARHPGLTKAQIAMARAFIERVPPGDLVGLATMSGRPEMSRSLTTDRKLILEAIDRLRMDAAAWEGEFDSSLVYTALAEYLGKAPGSRKAIVALTPGFAAGPPTPMLFRVDSDNHLNDRTRRLLGLVKALADGNVVPYVVDPIGDFFAPGDPLDAQKEKFNLRRTKSNDLARRGVVEQSVEWTGGFAVTGTNDYGAGFDRIVDDVSVYYMLDYTSSNQKADGKYRELRVEVTKPGIKVRTRSGYVAPKNK